MYCFHDNHLSLSGLMNHVQVGLMLILLKQARATLEKKEGNAQLVDGPLCELG